MIFVLSRPGKEGPDQQIGAFFPEKGLWITPEAPQMRQKRAALTTFNELLIKWDM
jgi:hypothetical protein